MDSSDSESIFINEAIAPAKERIAADRRGLSARQAAGCGMGYRKGGKTSFTVKDDMDIIKYMVQVAYPKYGYIGTWPGIVDCVAAHPKVRMQGIEMCVGTVVQSSTVNQRTVSVR